MYKVIGGHLLVLKHFSETGSDRPGPFPVWRNFSNSLLPTFDALTVIENVVVGTVLVLNHFSSSISLGSSSSNTSSSTDAQRANGRNNSAFMQARVPCFLRASLNTLRR
jgi:hypothetical protein